MENSGKLLFENDTAQWYVALGERWLGPLTVADVYEKIQNQEITWAHYVWRRGQPTWKRICETKPFQAAVPHEPAKAVQKEVKAADAPVVKPSSARKTSSEPKIWYLHYNDSQFGPFSEEEIKRFLKVGKIHSRVHAWKEGMSNWDRIERIPNFKEKAASSTPPPPTRKEVQKVEQRNSPRRPLVAKILMSDEQDVIVGVCRDISIGGLQVLTDKIPGPVGTKLKMNISPSSETGKRMESLVAEGVIVRILEDGRGFSFRFGRLSDLAKQAIEFYIDSST